MFKKKKKLMVWTHSQDGREDGLSDELCTGKEKRKRKNKNWNDERYKRVKVEPTDERGSRGSNEVNVDRLKYFCVYAARSHTERAISRSVGFWLTTSPSALCYIIHATLSLSHSLPQTHTYTQSIDLEL